MQSESGKCVDQLMLFLADIEKILDNRKDEEAWREHATHTLTETQVFVDNNKHIIPNYCLKKINVALRKLDSSLNAPQKIKLQFDLTNPSTLDKSSTLTDKVHEGLTTASKPIAVTHKYSLGFNNRSNEKLSLSRSEIVSKDICLTDLENCDVTIEGLANTVYMRNLKNCRVLICIATRAVTTTGCIDCNFEIVCQQLRIDSSTSCRFAIYTSARSMLESSKAIEFKCFDFVRHVCQDLMDSAHFRLDQNNWKSIDDFDWLCSSQPSKNYSVLS